MQVPRSDTRIADNNDCQGLSSLVMALFDGEADELQARRARNHLLICQTCANRWLDWNRARSLLLSVPAPTPPETLMWRVLSACRFAASGHRDVSSAHSHTHLNHGANHMQTAPDLAPSALSDQILARTTRVGAASSSAPTGDPVSPWPISVSPTRRVRSWPALAVPSVALWLLVLQREPLLLWSQAHNPTPADSALRVPERVQKTRDVRLSSAGPRRAKPLSRRVAVMSVPTQITIDEPTEMSDVAAQTSASPAFRNATKMNATNAALNRQWSEIEALTSNASRLAGWQSASTSNPAPSARFSASQMAANVSQARWQQSETPVTRSAQLRVSDAHIAEMRVPQMRGAELSDSQTAPRLRAAQWQVSASRSAGLIEIALPQTMPSRVSLPASSGPSSARLIAENFDPDDGRADEMRSVVDDFRATLAPEETPSDDNEEDLG